MPVTTSAAGTSYLRTVAWIARIGDERRRTARSAKPETPRDSDAGCFNRPIDVMALEFERGFPRRAGLTGRGAIVRGIWASRSTSLKPRRRVRSRQETEAALRSRFDDVRALLRRNVPYSGPVLESLLAGRVAVRPREDSPTSAPVFDVRIPLTTRGIFEEICCPKGGTSPAGFEPALPA